MQEKFRGMGYVVEGHEVGENPNNSINREKWRNFCTNPNEHGPEDFSYIVHAVYANRETKKITVGKEEIDFINVAKEPKRIHEIPVLACSLIGNKKDYGHTGTVHNVSNVCLILEVPPENILRSGPQDIASSRSLEDEQKRVDAGYGIGDPETLLRESSPQRGWGYNEVVIRGSSPSGQVRVIGIYLNNQTHDTSTSEEERSLAKEIAARLNIPIIAAQQKEIVKEQDLMEI